MKERGDIATCSYPYISQQGYSYVPKNIYILFRKISVSLKINLRHSIEVKLGIQENQI